MMTASSTATLLREAPAPPRWTQPPPPSALQWAGSSPDQLAFMREVYRRHVAASARRRTFVADLDRRDLAVVEGDICLRVAAAADARALLAAVRAAWSQARARGEPAAVAMARPSIASGYRDAPRQFRAWQDKFAIYYGRTADERAGQLGGPHGDAAATLLARFIGKRLAAPGFSNHQDGRAMDLSAGKPLSVDTRQASIDRWRRSWFWEWLDRNASQFNFFQSPGINEPWHWVHRRGAPSLPPPKPARSFSSSRTSAGASSSSPTSSGAPSSSLTGGPVPPAAGRAVPSGQRLVIDSVPLLASHRGIPPALVVRWSNVDSRTRDVDVVIHFHGFMPDGNPMDLVRHKLPISGLDATDPSGSGAPGRTRPTIYVLPRGNQVGKTRKYSFPALVQRGAIEELIAIALRAVGSAVGAPNLRRDRLILTAHSGGGAPLTASLAYNDPDEIQIFDGLYSDPTRLINWALARLRCEQSTCAKPWASLRVLYLAGDGTATNSRAVDAALRAQLRRSPTKATMLRRRFRAEPVRVGHNSIPGTYGWRLLADPSADVPR